MNSLANSSGDKLLIITIQIGKLFMMSLICKFSLSKQQVWGLVAVRYEERWRIPYLCTLLTHGSRDSGKKPRFFLVLQGLNIEPLIFCFCKGPLAFVLFFCVHFSNNQPCLLPSYDHLLLSCFPNFLERGGDVMKFEGVTI